MFHLMGTSHIGKVMMRPLYKFYEVVKVVSNRTDLVEINGFEAFVLGMAENNTGDWCYAVHMLESDEGWDVMENELVSTGKMMSREDFYDGDSVTVVVDSFAGEGKVKG